jgi:hypothetical protein
MSHTALRTHHSLPKTAAMISSYVVAFFSARTVAEAPLSFDAVVVPSSGKMLANYQPAPLVVFSSNCNGFVWCNHSGQCSEKIRNASHAFRTRLRHYACEMKFQASLVSHVVIRSTR